MLGRLLCAIGLHRWEFEDERQGDRVVTYGRCKRPSCKDYGYWIAVNLEHRRPW